jgi:monoamine oxidase
MVKIPPPTTTTNTTTNNNNSINCINCNKQRRKIMTCIYSSPANTAPALILMAILLFSSQESAKVVVAGEQRRAISDEDNAIVDVIIIGAGWSGLAAANRLREKGITDVRILEARDYVGGRSRTIEGYFVDRLATEVGSSWVYRGTEIDDIYNKLGLNYDISQFSFDDMKLYDDFGEISRSEAMEIKEDYVDGFVSYAEQNAGSNIDFDDLMDSYFDSERGLPNMGRQAINAFTATVNTDLGHIFDETDSSSVAWNLLWNEPLDFTAVPGGGYTRVVEDYAKPIVERIRLQSVVRKVDYTSASGIVEVTTDDSKVYYARAVICTVPIGVLQHRDIEFSPDLPSKKWDAIDSIGNGSVNKCVMYWDSEVKDISWWPEGDLELQLITQKDCDSDAWTYFINDQAHSTNEDYHVLTAWSAGDVVEELEAEDDAQTLDRVLSNLRKMFGDDVPEPTKILVTRWLSDPYSRGVHTFQKTGVDTGQARKELGKSVENVFFAGVAVLSGGNTVAAFDSGISVANNVVNSDFLVDKSSMEREVLIRSFLALSANSDLNNSTSPQGRALSWLVDDDKNRATLFHTNTSAIDIPERFAAATLYFATGGQDWNSSLNFLSDDSICDWNDDDSTGIFCNENGNVDEIMLVENSLSGSIPIDTNYFHELKKLWLQRNSLTGDICKGIVGGNMVSATADCAAAAFGGDITTKARNGAAIVQCECCTECCDRSGLCTATNAIESPDEESWTVIILDQIVDLDLNLCTSAFC